MGLGPCKVVPNRVYLIMIKCRVCGKEKPEQEMSLSHGKRSTQCYDCKREYDRIYHLNRSDEKRKKKNDLQRVRVEKHKRYVWDYFLQHPCVDCGESDPVVLDFDHIDPKTKYKEIGKMIGSSLQRIKEEIVKCEVRCSNCHRRRTAKQFGFYEFLQVR